MKKIIPLLILIPLFFGINTIPLVSQEKSKNFDPDIDSIVRPVYSMFKTKYGIIVYYQSYAPDSSAFSTPLYLPNEWFAPLSSRKEDSQAANIYAKLAPLFKNLNAPYIEFFYSNNKIKEIQVHLTKKDINSPLSYLPPELRSLEYGGSVDLEVLFENQKNSDIIQIY